jgi:hypothetical protein
MERFATAMWDFSWATRRFGNEAEYADWDRALDGLAERGYDNVRIDAFPHLIAADQDGAAVDRFELLPQRRRFMWGNHMTVETEPRADLITFIRKCKERDISIGLSSWYVADSRNRRDQVCGPDDYFRVWNETLELIDSAGLIEKIQWVDLCNEFPMDIWAWGAAPEIFGSRCSTPASLGIRGLPWKESAIERVQHYLSIPISKLKQNWPRLRFCYSFCSMGSGYMRSMDVSLFDVAEVHCWLGDSLSWNIATLQVGTLLEAPLGTQLHAALTCGVSTRKLHRWLDEVLSPRMTNWSDWANKNELPLITTEGWGPINYEAREQSDWRWVKEFAALAVERAVDMGWTGICTSNFCQPHHQGMWSDVQWHREMTSAIRGRA